LEGVDRGLFNVLSQNSVGECEQNHETPQSEYPVIQPKIEPGNPRKRRAALSNTQRLTAHLKSSSICKSTCLFHGINVEKVKISFTTTIISSREADHSPLSSADVNAWIYTSTPQYACMAWCSVKRNHRDNFTFTLTLMPTFRGKCKLFVVNVVAGKGFRDTRADKM